MNIQKCRFAAMVAVMLVVCMMVTTMIIPASAATAPIAVYDGKIAGEYLIAGVYEALGLDLQGNASYLELALSILGGKSAGNISAYLTADGRSVYVELNQANTFISGYTDEYSAESITTTYNIKAYYTNEAGSTYVLVPNRDPNTIVKESTVTFTYHSNSSFVNAIPENGLSLVLNEILNLLPIAIPVLIGFIGLNKAINFLLGVLHSA